MDAETRKTLNEQLDAMWNTINGDTTYDDGPAKLLHEKDETIARLNIALNIAESLRDDYETRALYWEKRAKNLINDIKQLKEKYGVTRTTWIKDTKGG